MSNFYALKYTDYEYMMLSLDAMDVIRKAPRDQGLEFDDIMSFSKRDTQFASWWSAPETSFIANTNSRSPKVPDLMIWQAGAALVLSPRARRLLGDVLNHHGELLPVRIMNEPEEYWIFNCLSRKEADLEKSAWEYAEGAPLHLKSIGFSQGSDDPIIFKTDFDNSTTLYCGEKFKAAVEEYGLKGLTFAPCGDLEDLESFIRSIGR